MTCGVDTRPPHLNADTGICPRDPGPPFHRGTPPAGVAGVDAGRHVQAVALGSQ